MPAWNPQPQVTIGGIDFTSDTVDRVTINSGRMTVEDQPRAGYANISLIVLDNTYPTITLNAVVVISVVDSTAAHVPIFTGYITDVDRTIDRAGTVANTVKINITAAGPLSRLAKFLTADSYAKEYDGTRITNILADVFSTSWNEVAPTTLTWAAVDPAKTWLTYDPGYVGTVETPGDYELTAYSGGAVEALSLSRLVANSGLGILYETGDGLVNYDSATTRIDRVIAEGFLELDADYISSTSVSSSSRTADLINQITISYKNNQTVTAQDDNSVATYGLFSGRRSTYLELTAQAEQQRDFFLNTRALPRVSINAISIPLQNPNLGNALRDDLLDCFCGTPLTIPNLPTAVYDAPFNGFIEGLSWIITQYTADLTLTVSEYGLSSIEQAWQQVAAAETWQTIQPTLTWENAQVVY